MSFTAKFRTLFIVVLLGACCAVTTAGQRLAVIVPNDEPLGNELADGIGDSLPGGFRVLDREMARAAFLSVSAADPFNMTSEEARRAGEAIGCDVFVIIRAAVQRRSASGGRDYFEAFAPVYVVSTRTGRLLLWRLERVEQESEKKAVLDLKARFLQRSADIAATAHRMFREERGIRQTMPMETPPDEGRIDAAGFKAPIPYRRVKPAYTQLAALYDVTATVEIEVDLGGDGTILDTRTLRWAGFGLDEEVERAVRSMNWRPAERAGKFIPMRFLLRYNFKKAASDN